MNDTFLDFGPIFNDHKMELEVYTFKPSSPLSMALIGIFEDVYRQIHSLGNLPLAELFEKSLNYFEKTSIPAMQKTIFKYTGFEIKKTFCREFYKENGIACTGAFSISLDMDKKGTNLDKVIGVIKGNCNKINHLTPETKEQMNKLLNNFDQSKEFFTHTSKLPNTIVANLYFDFATAFFSDKIVHKKISPLSPEEITAIMLHELGHLISIFNYFTYKTHSFKSFVGAFEHFNRYASVKEKVSFLKDKKYKEYFNEDKNKKKLESAFDKVVDELPNIDILTNTVGVLGVIIERLVTIMLSMLIRMFLNPSIFLLHLLTFHLVDYITDQNADPTLIDKNHKDADLYMPRNSDVGNLKKKMFSFERMADGYVISHNMGSFLQSALKKISDLQLYTLSLTHPSIGVGAIGNGFRKSNLFFHMNCICNLFLTTQLSSGFESLYVHEPFTYRIETMLRDQIDYIKMSSPSKEYQKAAIREYDNMIETIKNARNYRNIISSNLEKVTRLCFNLANICGAGILGRGAINYNEAKAVEQYLDEIEKLVDSDLYVTSQKFKLLV